VSVSGVTSIVRAAVADTITSGTSYSCYAYTPWDIPKASHAALGTLSWELSEHPDQSYGIRRVVIPIRLYQQLNNNTTSTLGYADTMLEDCIDAIGSDRTLGGVVASSDLSSVVTQAYYREQNGIAYCVTTLELEVFPFANTGG
jgi:hypothetical protein